MKLIVGLGNPEPRYWSTRHNAGFWVVDRLATKFGGNYSHAAKLYADTSKANIAGVECILAKPDTYMNLSGKSVQALLHWYKIELADCLVIHDDVALPLGRVRFQKGGGAGGNHGIESILSHLGGANGFDRLKFGVGPDPGGDRRADYVLSAIPESDKELKEQVLQLAEEAVGLWCSKGITEAMNKYNKTDLRPESQDSEPKQRKTRILAEEQHPISKRYAILEDNGASGWLYLSDHSYKPKGAVWVYNRIPAPPPDMVARFRDAAPPAAQGFAAEESLYKRPDKHAWKFLWDSSGQAVAVEKDGEPLAFVLPDQRAFSKLLVKDGPWGSTWSSEIFASVFGQQSSS